MNTQELEGHMIVLRALRADIDAGISSLDAGMGQEIDMNDVIVDARHRHEER